MGKFDCSASSHSLHLLSFSYWFLNGNEKKKIVKNIENLLLFFFFLVPLYWLTDWMSVIDIIQVSPSVWCVHERVNDRSSLCPVQVPWQTGAKILEITTKVWKRGNSDRIRQLWIRWFWINTQHEREPAAWNCRCNHEVCSTCNYFWVKITQVFH